MIVLKRALPRLPLVTLVLGGCSSDGEDDLATLQCRASQACDPTVFAEDFDGFADCVSSRREDIAYYYSGSDCYDALVALSTCQTQVYAASCDLYAAYDAPECADESGAYMDCLLGR